MASLRISLDGEMRADAAIRVILRTLLQTMRDNLEGTRCGGDAEFLHDFRVALRRTRSCLSQIKGVFPAEEVEPFRRELSWLGEITGPKRDLDVHLLSMQDYCNGLPEAAGAELSDLIELLERDQRAEQQRLATLLDSERCRQLFDGWGRFFERSDPVATEAQNASRPIVEVAAERIAHAFTRVLKRGRGIGPRTKASRLHRLRIDCKKLRYLLEFFRSLYDPEDLRPVVRSLRRLQDCLGDFNDLAVQQVWLRDLGLRMSEEGSVVQSQTAIGQLVEHLAQRQDRQRRQFAQRFAGFDSPATRERLLRITQRDHGDGETRSGSVGPDAQS